MYEYIVYAKYPKNFEELMCSDSSNNAGAMKLIGLLDVSTMILRVVLNVL